MEPNYKFYFPSPNTSLFIDALITTPTMTFLRKNPILLVYQSKVITQNRVNKSKMRHKNQHHPFWIKGDSHLLHSISKCLFIYLLIDLFICLFTSRYDNRICASAKYVRAVIDGYHQRWIYSTPLIVMYPFLNIAVTFFILFIDIKWLNKSKSKYTWLLRMVILFVVLLFCC